MTCLEINEPLLGVYSINNLNELRATVVSISTSITPQVIFLGAVTIRANAEG